MGRRMVVMIKLDYCAVRLLFGSLLGNTNMSWTEKIDELVGCDATV